MVCKVNSIFDEIFKIYRKKSGFTDFMKDILKNERFEQFKEKRNFSNPGRG